MTPIRINQVVVLYKEHQGMNPLLFVILQIILWSDAQLTLERFFRFLDLKPDIAEETRMGESANIIDLEDGWFMLHRRIVKLINQLASAASQHYEPSTRDYMYIYSTVYKMCNQEPPNEYSQQIYDKYCQSLKEYIISKVLPALRKELTDEFLVLRELVKWWEHHKAMIRYLSNMFYYVDDIFVQENELLSLAKVGFTCFHD